MLWRMLPLQSRTSTTERGILSPLDPEASRKYDTSCRNPSSRTTTSLGPRPRTKCPAPKIVSEVRYFLEEHCQHFLNDVIRIARGHAVVAQPVVQ